MGSGYINLHVNSLPPVCHCVCNAFYIKDGMVVLLEKKGESGWMSKCSLVKSGGIPQGIHTALTSPLTYNDVAMFFVH